MRLRTKTSLLLALFVVMVIGVLGAYSIHLAGKALKNAVLTGLQGVSRTGANHVEAWLAESLRVAQAIGVNLPREVLEGRDTEGLTAYLKNMGSIHTQFDNGIFVLDREGTMLADYPEQDNVHGKNFGFRPYFKRSMSEGHGVVGEPYVSARTNEPVITFTAILRGPNGEVEGLLGCSSRLLGPSALGGLRAQRIGESGYIYIFDRSRLMILHPKDERVLKRDVPRGANRLLDAAIDGYDGVGITTNSRGVSMLISLTHVPGTDWVIAAQQPVAEALKPIADLRLRVVLSALVGAFVALTLGIFAIRRITLPLGKLHQSAIRLKQRYANSFDLKHSSGNPGEAASRSYRAPTPLPDDEITLLARTMTDLSQGLDEAMGALSESESRYRTLFEMAQEPILLLNHEGWLIDCNHAAERLFSATRSDLLARSLADLTPTLQPDGAPSRERARGLIQAALADMPQRFEWVHETIDGERFDAEVVLGAVSVGKESGLLAVVRDIRKQKQAQAHLLQEWERLTAVLDGNPIASFMIDPERRVVLWNRACEVMTRIRRSQVLGNELDLAPLFQGRKIPTLASLLLDHTDEEILASYGNEHNLRFNPEMGTIESSTYIFTGEEKRVLRASAARIRDGQGNLIGVVQSAQDLTREDELQHRLLQASKMESIGTMAGGMAHEFNNILAVIQGHAQLLHMDIDRAPLDRTNGTGVTAALRREFLDHVRQIEVGCQRAATLTRNMLTFARTDKGKMAPTKVGTVLENVLQLLKQTLPPSVSLDVNLDLALPFIMADAGQLEQAIVNLVVNARDALPRGGSISIRGCITGGIATSGRSKADGNGTGRDESCVQIEVADTGEGIPLDHLDRIFDPFFTTKEPGKGTGLGLSIVYSIVKAHGGSIHVESERPGGSRFLMSFPALMGEPDRVADILPARERSLYPGKGESLLIVDDEEQVRRLLGDMLQKAGYRVVSAADGKEALQRFSEAVGRSAPFDLVILDLAMPVMGGRECLSEIVALDPSAKVLLASGLVDEEIHGEILQKASGILKKPFQVRELTKEVRRILG